MVGIGMRMVMRMMFGCSGTGASGADGDELERIFCNCCRLCCCFIV